MLVGKRRRMLRYLERSDLERYRALVAELGLRADDRRRRAGPDFTLRDQDGEEVSLSDYRGRKVLLVFYPFDFSSVCSDQLSLYQEVKPEIEAKGVELVGISVDHILAHKAFQEKLGIDTTLLADFEPKGEVATAYGSYLERLRHGQPHAGPGRRGRQGRLDLRIAEPRRVSRRQRHLRRARLAVVPDLTSAPCRPPARTTTCAARGRR